MNRRDFLLAAAAAPLAMRVAPSRFARQLAGTPVALVTADQESRVVAFDLTIDRVAGYIDTLPGPRSIESLPASTAVIAHTEAGALTILDGRALRVRHVVHGLQEPRYTAAGPTGRLAYVTDAGRGELVVLDVLRGRIIHRARVGAKARHVTIDRDGKHVWTALGFSASELVVLDLADPFRPKVVQRIEPPFKAHDVVFAPGGRRVWISSGDAHRLAIYDAKTFRLLRTMEADAPPQHIAFTSEAAWVASGDSASVHVHALANGRLLRSTPVPEGSYNVTKGWGRVLTPSLERGTLTVLNEYGTVLSRARVAQTAHDACFVLSAPPHHEH